MNSTAATLTMLGPVGVSAVLFMLSSGVAPLLKR